MQRRHFLRSAGLAAAAAASGAATAAPEAGRSAAFAPRAPDASPPPPRFAPIRATPDRIIALNVCLRPFRAQGPRIEAERHGRKTVIHSYGHGGSGWSLSWGSGVETVDLALRTGEKRLAVVGAGAIGLTAARVAQQAGFKVKIYAKEFHPMVRSSFATGVWSPASRICTSEHATPEFRETWQRMTRHSFSVYQGLLGLAGAPVRWQDVYLLADAPRNRSHAESGEPDYPDLERELTPELLPVPREVAAGGHPFPVASVRGYSRLIFNIGSYAKMLADDFLRAGGELETREFSSLDDILRLDEKAIVNATGYGARALLGDESLVPVRGQLARLVPQPEVDYGFYWLGHNLSVVSRTDGIVVQAQGEGDFGNDDTTPDRAQTEKAIERLASLYPVDRT